MMLVVQGREDLHWKSDTLMQECEPIHATAEQQEEIECLLNKNKE